MFLLDHDAMDLHREYWNESTIQGFWTGESFSIDGDAQDLARIVTKVCAGGRVHINIAMRLSYE